MKEPCSPLWFAARTFSSFHFHAFYKLPTAVGTDLMLHRDWKHGRPQMAPQNDPPRTISCYNLAPSRTLADALRKVSPVIGCSIGSTLTLLHTSVTRLAVRSLISHYAELMDTPLWHKRVHAQWKTLSHKNSWWVPSQGSSCTSVQYHPWMQTCVDWNHTLPGAMQSTNLMLPSLVLVSMACGNN